MRQRRHFWHFLTSVRSAKHKKRREWGVGAVGWPKHWLYHQFAWLLKPAVLNLHNSLPPLQILLKTNRNKPKRTKANLIEPQRNTGHTCGGNCLLLWDVVVVVVVVASAAVVVVLLCLILCLFAFRTRMRDIFVSAVESVFLILFFDFVFWFGFFFVLSSLCVRVCRFGSLSASICDTSH